MYAFRALLSAAALLAAVIPAPSQADSIELHRFATNSTFYPGGYQGVADNNIFYYSAADSSTIGPAVWMRSSDGNNGKIRAATSGSGSHRNLLRFDLSGMSGQGVTVTTDATFTLTYNGPGFGTYSIYQIAPANAGWTESTNNITLNPSSATFPSKSNQGDPTWWYKSIDNATYAGTTGFKTSNTADTTSVTWASMQVDQGNNGSNPEGYRRTGGLWNPIDLVDQNPATVVNPDPEFTYITMSNMDPVSSTDINQDAVDGAKVTLTIPMAMIQSWIDNPADNAGLLGRFVALDGLSPTVYTDFYSSENGTTGNRPSLSFEYSITQTLAGDFNGDHSVDAVDLAIWRQQYGTSLDAADFLTWQRNLGQSNAVAAASSVPEPASALLITACAGALLNLRKRR